MSRTLPALMLLCLGLILAACSGEQSHKLQSPDGQGCSSVAAISQGAWNGSDCQRWTLKPSGEAGFLNIAAGGQCMTIENNAVVPGAAAIPGSKATRIKFVVARLFLSGLGGYIVDVYHLFFAVPPTAPSLPLGERGERNQ